MHEIVPVILSGGAGTRLWPLSREMRPKQLLPLLDSRATMLQDTAKRIAGRPIVVCNDEHRFIVAEQLRQAGIEPRAVVVEPVGRNTAPAVAVASLLVADNPDAVILVMPSDHRIRDGKAFAEAVAKAEVLARQGHLVTFGIIPRGPATGYGYIRKGKALTGGFAVEQFVEKPDLATAQGYVASGDYFWNSGIFMLPPAVFMEELQSRLPAMAQGCRDALAKGKSDLFFFRLDSDAFAAIAGQSVDYAVMEHTRRAAVVPVEMGWSDVGSFSALWEEGEHDDHGNVELGDVMTVNVRNSYLRSDRQLVAAIGLDDVVLVATDDVVLALNKNADQDVKKIVEELKARKRPEATQGTRCWRPWGWYQNIDQGERFLVKHIQVNPGAKLSLQKHWHRSEHWVVVTGTALVTCGDKLLTLRENESAFIPVGTPHRLENPGKLPLRMIEVQSGEYIGEDDIVRLDDVYGRAPA